MIRLFSRLRYLALVLPAAIILSCGPKGQEMQTSAGAHKKVLVLDKAQLAIQALDESAIPIRPGKPGESEFWNRRASRFIHAPSFEFAPLKGAARYRFTLVPDDGGEPTAFEAEQPWETLAPVWVGLPVGDYSLTVEGIGPDGEVVETAGKRGFYRAATFAGPYGDPAVDYRECARRGLKFLFDSDIIQNWLEHGKPDPRYSLYCYPSKMIAAVIRGMLVYSLLEPSDSAVAVEAALEAARYLIAASEPAGAALEYFPPTYDSTHTDTTVLYENDIDYPYAFNTVKKYHGQVMLLYPAAVAGAYLDLFERTGDPALVEAARGIADTYARIQSPDGNWPLKLYFEDGSPVVDNLVNPSRIISLLERLEKHHSPGRYPAALEAARANVHEAFERFEFEGQFEDIEPDERFENLSHYPATGSARRLLKAAEQNPDKYIPLAIEAIRFAEDQFVIWERPLPVPRPDGSRNSKGWFTPCVLEQYECYLPVDASAADMIETYGRAYAVTGRDIFLAKAVSLANQMTLMQDEATGLMPTWWEKGGWKAIGWINCAIADAETLLEFAELTDTLGIRY